MDRISVSLLVRLTQRLQLPLWTLVLLLQRTPVIKLLVDKQFSSAPRAAHLLKWLTGVGVTVGGLNTVTGATASVKLLEGFDNTQGTLGEYFRLSFASTAYTVGSYRLGANPPPGLTLSPTVNEFGVGTIDGIPTRAGIYNVDIHAYENDNHTGDSTLLAITVYILEKGPNITDQPNGVSLQWGTPLNLSVSLRSAEGATFQWQKDGVNIVGATVSTYQLSQATSQHEGVYTVQVTKDGITVSSDPASVSVMATGIQRWKEEAFNDPFGPSTDAQLDPDLDGLSNFIEYAIGSDPEVPNTAQMPVMGRENRFGIDYVAYSYPKNPNATDVSIDAEYVDRLGEVSWTQVVNLQNGILLEDTPDALKVLVPVETVCFVRFKLSGPEIN